MKLEKIKELPTCSDEFEIDMDPFHESLFRSYHILSYVLDMVKRGDSKETIFEVVEYLKSKD